MSSTRPKEESLSIYDTLKIEPLGDTEYFVIWRKWTGGNFVCGACTGSYVAGRRTKKETHNKTKSTLLEH